MNRISKFHKVSFEQFTGDWTDTFGEVSQEELQAVYEGIRLPVRATSGSAGYDFFSPAAFSLGPGETIKIPRESAQRLMRTGSCRFIQKRARL